jgi:hypothetical protein
MNERIREFAIQSGLPTALDYHQKRYEKFAELIVQECANQVDWILAEGGKTQGDLIKQHFGVKK